MTTELRNEGLQSLARLLVTKCSFEQTLELVSRLSIDAVEGAQIAGISLLDGGGRLTQSAYTEDLAPAVDQTQHFSGRSPCLDAWRSRIDVQICDLEEAQDRYPEFSAACTAAGIRSTLSFGLVAGDEGMGALNLYSRTPNGFSAGDVEVGADLASAASAVLANARAYWAALELAEGLQEAMKSRSVIEQAKGMLMALTEGLDADGAFDLLRKASQRENVKLRDIAARIVSGSSSVPSDASRELSQRRSG